MSTGGRFGRWLNSIGFLWLVAALLLDKPMEGNVQLLLGTFLTRWPPLLTELSVVTRFGLLQFGATQRVNDKELSLYRSGKTLNADSDGKVYHYTHCCQHHSQHENGIYFSAFNSYNFQINIF
jgi:hypothetical protein